MKKTITSIAIFISLNSNAQNVGIGETSPTESKLQIKTVDSAALIIQNTSTPNNTKTGFFFKSDNNYAGNIATIKTAASTYRMGLYTFGGPTASALQERLSILDNGNVGVGTINPAAKLEIAGSLKITNGSQGVGKVLTSDAVGNAIWANAPYGNTERFYFRLSSSISNPIALSTIYNFGTATTTYTAGLEFFRINFTKSGLYHFDINASQACSNDYSPNSATPKTMEIECFFAPSINFLGYPPYLKGNLGFSSASYDKSFEVYITAPSYIQFYSLKQSGNIVYGLNVNGHLISE